MKESAFKYLKEKQGSKGKDNVYKDLSMAKYLLPYNNKLTIVEKQNLFSVKTEWFGYLLIFLNQILNTNVFGQKRRYDTHL